MSKIPVALFCYNRPKHLLNTLKSMVSCSGKEQFEFYFFSDGPKSPHDDALVAEVRQILSAYAPHFSAELNFRPANLGLARSIVKEVSKLCSMFGMAVVLEDDLTLEQGFFEYMLAALNFYREDSSVMQVGACSLWTPEGWPLDAYFLPVTTTWGWGTWKRAWDSFSWQPKGWPATKADEAWYRLFSLDNSVNFERMLEHQIKGLIDSWGVLWWYAVSRQKGRVIYPRHPLIVNRGLDGSGVHKDVIPDCAFSVSSSVEARPEFQVNSIRLPKNATYLPEHLLQFTAALKKISGVN